jgi:hypothetical protein
MTKYKHAWIHVDQEKQLMYNLKGFLQQLNMFVKGGRLYADIFSYMDGLSPADRQRVLRGNV